MCSLQFTSILIFMPMWRGWGKAGQQAGYEIYWLVRRTLEKMCYLLYGTYTDFEIGAS